MIYRLLTAALVAHYS